ncbi:hypothetical protein ACLKA7_017691 [Drosophila subpalustris]
MSLTTLTRKRKIAAAIILHCCLEEEEEQELKLRTRTTWVQELYLEREESGFFRSFQSIFRSNSPDRLKDFVRMNPDDFDFILERVRPLIEKADTRLRRAISAAERLAVTLRYLATGDSMQSLSFLFKISVPSISMMVHEGCDAIYKTLKDDFLKETALPSSAPAVLQTVRKPRSRPDAINIEPKEKMTYSEILNLVNRIQDDKLKSVGESVHRVKCTAKGALLLELNETNPKSTQQLRDNIGSVLERKVHAHDWRLSSLQKAAKDQAMKKATKRAGQPMQALDLNHPAFAGQLQRASGSKPTLAFGQSPQILQNIQRLSEDMSSFFNKMYKPNDYINGI